MDHKNALRRRKRIAQRYRDGETLESLLTEGLSKKYIEQIIRTEVGPIKTEKAIRRGQEIETISEAANEAKTLIELSDETMIPYHRVNSIVRRKGLPFKRSAQSGGIVARGLRPILILGKLFRGEKQGDVAKAHNVTKQYVSTVAKWGRQAGILR